ncbi:unnamed protein product [Camellia sinensis]
MVGLSCKRHDQLRAAQATDIAKKLAIDDEFETGKGKNQIGTLKRVGDTRWGSHLGSICSLINMFSATCAVLRNIINDGSKSNLRAEADGVYDSITSFEFVFILHLMRDIMEITNDLCQALQSKSQDILNAMHLVFTTKILIQKFREDGWVPLLEKIKLFSNDHGIQIPDMSCPYKGGRGRSRSERDQLTMEHHFRVDIFMITVDSQLQELNNKFKEDVMELFVLSSALDPRDGYRSFNIEDICKLANKFYPMDFSEQEKLHLKYQLENYKLDISILPEFQKLSTISELCQMLAKTKKSTSYPLIDRLIRLVLTLPVSTATSERAILAMKLVKSKLRNRMEDGFLTSYLITYIEQDIARGFDRDAKSTGKKSKEGERKKAAESNRDVDKDRVIQDSKPYVFEDHHFTIETETQRGRVRLLPKFTERSKLLRGIENYRLAILETEPQTFVVPNHRDADGIFFVTRGEGSISLVHQDRRESFNLRCGDILRIPEGTTVYLINKSNNEKLVIMTLLQPVSIPGHFEAFFGPGGENPESYFSAFSSSLLEAALNTKRDKIQRLFGQREGIIIKASEEQIKAMTHHEEGYGQLYQVDPDEFRDLRELNLAIGFANFTGGSMTAPYYNSRATKIAVVANGEGYFEMACPHLSSSEFGGSSSSSRGSHPQQRRSSGPNYQKVSGRLSRGVVFIIPPGHPVITVASKNQNLQIVCFDVNALNNEKFPLAGRRNIINQLSPEAKELAFNAAAREVDEVFKNQEDEFFFEGPRQQHEREREHEYEEGCAYA